VRYCLAVLQRELAPYDPDWYYVRAAAVARKVYLRPGRGVGGLSKVFGTTERRGSRPAHHSNASRGLIRHILQQLEEMDVVEKTGRGGRKVTRNGQQDLDRIGERSACLPPVSCGCFIWATANAFPPTSSRVSAAGQVVRGQDDE
jgi:ribosomal protein S19E (S16A)